MILMLRAIEAGKNGKKTTTDPYSGEFVPEDLKKRLDELFSEIRRDVIEPFFKADDLKSIEKKWSDWILWYAPLGVKLLLEAGDVISRMAASGDLKEKMFEGLDGLSAEIAKISPALSETFSWSLKTGIISELVLLPRKLKIEKMLNVHDLPVKQRILSSFGFGLALMLLASAREHRGFDGKRIRFLVLKMKRHASAAYMSSREIVDFIEAGNAPG